MYLQVVKKCFALFFSLIIFLFSCEKTTKKEKYILEGTLKKWEPITLTFDGPRVSETDSINPFLDYALWVSFFNGNDTISVHGYFTADGDAANTQARSGSKWRVKFTPDKVGIWQFDAYFLQGKEIAVKKISIPKKNSGVWKIKGGFAIKDQDSTAIGFYKTGMLTYRGKHYLQEAETKNYFLKNGVGSPENFLAYHEFDGTFDNGGTPTPTLTNGLHEYAPHIGDWRENDPTWGDEKGKGIFGALNYMAEKGINSLSFLTMNVAGDGNDVWPWTAPKEQTRYDVSKLDQWEKVFDHMDRLGIAMNVFIQETESDTLLNKGELGLERKLYYKELVARFGHHLGVVWNLGEETNRTASQLKSYASYLRAIDPYDHPIAVHNHIRVSGKRIEGRPLDAVAATFTPLLGYPDFEIASLQMLDTTEVHREIQKWVDRSKKRNKSWAVYLDQIGQWDIGVTTDTAANNNHAMVMRTSLWGSLMSSGAGTSWYFGGLDEANSNLAAEDFRSRDQWWGISANAPQFFLKHLPFWEMQNHDDLLSNPKAFCFAKKDQIYLVYLPKNETTDLTIGDGAFTIAFYDPKEGGKLYDKPNEGWKITKPNSVELSAYNSRNDRDWVIVIAAK
ncbi:DUF5060 domain-containing protein [Pareuzebyella sediminis]|uniref:DUF5060 domain-containing protein n=1 Tax=Pareuzebyella sediminis TaxID=2607998 RepID=UPI0011EC0B19|nr:DUF5060 domain-containing protein [Pareuzebyella sediminis]